MLLMQSAGGQARHIWRPVTLKMEAAVFSETFLPLRQSTRRHIPEDNNSFSSNVNFQQVVTGNNTNLKEAVPLIAVADWRIRIRARGEAT